MQNARVSAKGEALPDRTRQPLPANRYLDHHPSTLPDVYALTCEGKCMEPLIADGSKLLFSRIEPYRSGDLVLIFKKREHTVPGDHQMVVKRLFWAPPIEYWDAPEKWPYGRGSVVLAEMLNPATRLAFNADALLGIHKCLGPVPEGHKTYKVDDAWIREQARLRSTAE